MVNPMLLRRYLTRQLLFSTLVIATALTMIIWLTQSLRLLDLVISGGAPLNMFGTMLLLTVPRFFELILPIALAISIVFLFNKLITDSELIVMQACGLSPWQLLKAVLFLGVAIGVVVLLLGGWGTPKANKELDRMRDLAKSGFSLNLLRPGVFNTLGDDMTIYLSERNGLDDLRGLLIHFSPADKPSETIWAKRGGMLSTDDDKPIVIVYDGMRQQFNTKTNRVESLRFESYRVDLSTLMQKPTRDRSNDPAHYNLNRLFDKIPELTDDKSRREFTAEANNRLARPFLALSFALCAVTPFLLGGYNRRGNAWRIVGTILALVGLQAIYLGAMSLAQKNMAANAVLYMVAIVPSFICGWYMMKAHAAGMWRYLRTRVHDDKPPAEAVV
jgi:lipopolysaccharide export system permease protein